MSRIHEVVFAISYQERAIISELTPIVEEQLFHVGVKALVHDSNGNLLLLNITRKDGKTYWDLPGGRVNENESMEGALNRELQEETSLTNLAIQKHLGVFMTDITIPLVNLRHARLLFSVYLYAVGELHAITTENNMTAHWVAFDKALNDRIGYFPSDLLNAIKAELTRVDNI